MAPNATRIALRAFLIAAVFVVAGYAAERAITAHALAHGTPEVQVRMAALMTGLFAGGLAAVLTTLALLLRRH